MGILSNLPHRCSVVPKTKVEGRHGVEMVDGEPIEVPCFVQAVSAEELESEGLQVATAYRVFATAWPGGPYSTVIYEGDLGQWPGRRWSQVGEARRFGHSSRTSHYSVIISAKDAEAK
ncbi:hypothetical protein [Rothia nasimurium]|uniref:hypothetical protein n=1 Tax=Rothia nasimurium TaxID=85336 RepID=UPI001F2EC1DE|nr:hypothetical protein [Rothia nasimurium]